MTALFLLVLVLMASGGAAGCDDGATLELRGVSDSSRERATDELPHALTDIMSTSGCGRFAGLLAATPSSGNIFRQRLAGGLTVFCPDDKAVAAFDPTLRALADQDRVDLLLHHGAAACYDRAQLLSFEWVAVATLAAADATTNTRRTVIVGQLGDAVWVGGTGRITRTVSSEEANLVVHVVDAVLLPRQLRRKLDGEDEAAYLCLAAASILANCTDAPKKTEPALL